MIITYMSQSKCRQTHQGFTEEEYYHEYWTQEPVHLVTEAVKEFKYI